MKIALLIRLYLVPTCVTSCLAAQQGAANPPDGPPSQEWQHAMKRDLGEAKDFVPHKVTFRKVVIDPALGESVAAGDVNGDKKPDIVSGDYWYRNPDWKKSEFRRLLNKIKPDGTDYEYCGGDDLMDVDGDGDLDVIATHLFTGTMTWYENPGKKQLKKPAKLWTAHSIAQTKFIEFHMLVDLNGDGKKGELLPNNNEIAWYARDPRDPKMPWIRHEVSSKPPGHGIGVGDVNKDGWPDILTRAGWIEAPKSPGGKWTPHSFNWGRATEEIYALDLDDDGDQDLLASEAHGYGIYWAENLGPDNSGGFDFKVHVIDATWAQIHTLNLVDFDRDGDLDIFAGKRHLAHNGRDPGEQEPSIVVWYEKLKGAHWTKHAISVDGGVGTGYRIPVIDIDGDGDLDIVVKGKKAGLVLFLNQTRSK